MSEASVEREAGSGFGVLSSAEFVHFKPCGFSFGNHRKAAEFLGCETLRPPFRPRWKLRTVKTRLAIAFGGGQVYVVGRAAVDNGNSG